MGPLGAGDRWAQPWGPGARGLSERLSRPPTADPRGSRRLRVIGRLSRRRTPGRVPGTVGRRVARHLRHSRRCRKGPRGVRGVKERWPQLRVLRSAGGSCRVASRPGASEPRLQNGDPAVAASRSREQVACHGAGRGVIPDPTGFPLFLRPFCSFPLSLSQTREVLSAREVGGFLSRINHFPKCPDSLQSWAVEAGKPEFYDSQHEALKSEGFSVLPRSPVRS